MQTFAGAAPPLQTFAGSGQRPWARSSGSVSAGGAMYCATIGLYNCERPCKLLQVLLLDPGWIQLVREMFQAGSSLANFRKCSQFCAANLAGAGRASTLRAVGHSRDAGGFLLRICFHRCLAPVQTFAGAAQVSVELSPEIRQWSASELEQLGTRLPPGLFPPPRVSNAHR